MTLIQIEISKKGGSKTLTYRFLRPACKELKLAYQIVAYAIREHGKYEAIYEGAIITITRKNVL